MAGPSRPVDSSRIATTIKSASGSSNPGSVLLKINPTRACPNCQYTIGNSNVTQQWPGLPRGVEFIPSDQEIIWHLLAKSGLEGLRLHPSIDDFIATVDQEDGICLVHPIRACPNCQYTIDNSDVAQQGPGLQRVVEFVPSDREIICHLLLANSGLEVSRLHPSIDEFTPTVDQEDGICLVHPQLMAYLVR